MKSLDVFKDDQSSQEVETGPEVVGQLDVAMDKMTLVALGLKDARDLSRADKPGASQSYVDEIWERWHPGQPMPQEFYIGRSR